MTTDDLLDAIEVEATGETVVLGIRQRRLWHMQQLQPYQARIVASNLIDAAKLAEAAMARRAVST